MTRKLALVALITLAALALPASAPAEHCNDISVYTQVPTINGSGISWEVGWVGCSAGEDRDTDVFLPGSNGVMVFAGAEPVNGYIDALGRVQGSTLDYDGTITLLAFVRGNGVNGAPNNVWRSQLVAFPQPHSLEPGHRAAAHVCFVGGDCRDRAARSPGS